MKNEFLEYAVLLEKALAGFYEKLKNQDSMIRIKQVLEFMETHSMEHSQRLAETVETLKRPELAPAILLDYQNNVTKKVQSEIEDEKDLLNILETLASSEEKLGNLYNGISDHLIKLARHLEEVSGEFSAIAKEEYAHRDLLLADKKRLQDRKKP